MRALAALGTGAAVLAGVAVGGYAMAGGAGAGDYEVQVAFPNAANLVDGSPVQVKGRNVGEVTSLVARDGQAIVRVAVGDEYAPLPTGTTAWVEWKGAIGERIVQLAPGPESNPNVPYGGMIDGGMEQVEVDQLLAALDRKTRTRLSSLLRQLDTTMAGREPGIQATLRAAGPAVQALGEVMQAVGRDGPAIRDLLNQLDRMSAVLAAREDELRQTIGNLTEATGAAAQHHRDLRAGLRELPPTLRTAQRTLDRVPEASAGARRLLDAMKPAAARLPSFARNLSPLLREARPAINQMRPTLVATQRLLWYTPALLDRGHDTLPGTTRAIRQSVPAMGFLRPYTPEAIGWLTNWATAFSPVDSQGHYWHAQAATSGTGSNDNPGVLPPGVSQNPEPAPGSAEGQPWTDANGDGMR